MMQPVLIVINGIPGSGKTTVARRLSKDLPLPHICKDDIKERLYDVMGVGDLQWSQDLGAATAEMLLALIDKLLERRRSFIVESAFFKEFTADRLATIIKKRHPVTVLEIYCATDPEVRKQRYIARNESGARHPGHVDHNHYKTQSDDAEVAVRYAPLEISTCLIYDTTSPDEQAYQHIVKTVRQHMRTQSEKESSNA